MNWKMTSIGTAMLLCATVVMSSASGTVGVEVSDAEASKLFGGAECKGVKEHTCDDVHSGCSAHTCLIGDTSGLGHKLATSAVCGTEECGAVYTSQASECTGS